MKVLIGGAALLAISLAGHAVPQTPEALSWQDAVAELASERTRAEACAGLAKQYLYGSADDLARARLGYADAKAEMDGVIGALIVVLAQEGTPKDFAAVETQLSRAVSLRLNLCESIVAEIPEREGEGTKGILTDVLAKTLAALIDAVKEIYIYHQEEDMLERQTIQAQLEATRWRDFSEIPG